MLDYALWLDDTRDPPINSKLEWIVFRTAEAAIEFIECNGLPFAASLDHDLGQGNATGHDFLCKLCAMIPELGDSGRNKLWLMVRCTKVHSANIIGGQNMENMLKHIIRYLEQG